MSRTKVKVCGIKTPGEAELALECGADYIGINFYKKSPRYVAKEKIQDLFSVIPAGKRVMVDVSTATDQLEEYLAYGFDHYQIHFDLNISMASVAGWSGLVGEHALWLAPKIPPSDEGFPQILMEFANTILLDSYTKSGYGGSGISGQNWQKYLDFSVLYQHKSWILAGGLGPDNIQEALRQTEALYVDVNSGVESSPGVKDPEKLKRLFDRIHEWDRLFE